MAEFKLYGRFIAMSEVKEVASSTGGQSIRKREVYIDCTRRDMFTGQQIGNENKVLLEFGGDKVLDKMAALKLQKDDVVVVDFSIVGAPYNDKQTGKMKVFTSIRCYDINVASRAGQQPQQPQAQQQAAEQTAQAPVQAPAPQPAPAPAVQQPVNQENDGTQGLPF